MQVILPIIGQDRLDSNDNTAEAEREVDVLEGPEVEISSCEFLTGNGEPVERVSDLDVDMDLGKKEDDSSRSINDQEPNLHNEESPPVLPVAEPDNRFYEVEAIIDGPKRRREHLVSCLISFVT